jgi:tRNA (guanine37-N1)-methyltransferase
MSGELKKILRDQLAPEEMAIFVQSYDIVGDIAIIVIPDALLGKKRLIAGAILDLHRRIKVVARRAGIHDGEFRTLPLEIIGGEDRKETLHRENGVRLLVDPEAVYFSVRSGNERQRIASLVQPGERVLVFFSGIGPYPLVIGRTQPQCRVIGIEKSPIAHAYAMKNLGYNRRLTNVLFYEGDVRAVVPRLKKTFDRIVMPLPKSAEGFLDLALLSLQHQRWLHFYDMQEKGNFAGSIEKVKHICRQQGRSLVAATVTICGHFTPRLYRICVDALIG